ncbi:RdgB/HAM1 family non-canonical purine NTP pyrophosphatase [Pengzhenrongella sicca]|uniref:dITP/XTP pyrophosphatase n=1 Tax=Pengzhenrongella sicca TaxID=2819238 RepID=A0A8A4ZEK3_9MICO|nr:RdgB/HAM1 family non-canonical purine NTP pyrophosphatase [Pengzhenrongella sicca]QTE30410.1 RdgB/HAM1 family non-canonical purine NTP pyrophosphatase [Pengzhenrongella sicca]
MTLTSGGATRGRVVLATHNAHKVGELRAILAGVVPGLGAGDVVGAAELGAPEPVEDGVTFAANALIKARALAAFTGLTAVADDSGLAVDVLGGAPGIFSARWSGRHGDDVANLELLLAQLADVGPEHRGAQFVCAAALVTPEGYERVEHGYLRGTLATVPRGEHGFGYDPILVVAGGTRTSAELTPAEKNAISHRGEAFRALAPVIAGVLAGRRPTPGTAPASPAPGPR